MRVATLLLAAILSTTALGPAGAQEGRYLYVVGCGARVDKLDVAEGHKVASFDLAAAAKAIPSGPGPLDGCLANQAVYDSKSSIFYTVVPLQAETKPNDAKDYRVLGFSIPALKLVYSQPAGDDLKDAPRIEASPAGGVKIVATPNPGPPLYLDLSAFESEMGPLGNQILEVSDGRFLLRLHMFNRKEWGFAVVDPTAHKLVVLKDLPAMTAPQAHLTPGGGAVLVLASTGARSFFQSTGNLTSIRRDDGPRAAANFGFADQDHVFPRHRADGKGDLPFRRELSVHRPRRKVSGRTGHASLRLHLTPAVLRRSLTARRARRGEKPKMTSDPARLTATHAGPTGAQTYFPICRHRVK